jgi:5'(3')-deoxyribonucleotidase
MKANYGGKIYELEREIHFFRELMLVDLYANPHEPMHATDLEPTYRKSQCERTMEALMKTHMEFVKKHYGLVISVLNQDSELLRNLIIQIREAIIKCQN